MKITFKSKKFRLVACGLWLVACGLLLVACKQESRAEISASAPCAQLPSCIAALRSSITRKVIGDYGVNQVSLDEFRIYDLSFPNSENYLNSPKLSVFYGSPSSIPSIISTEIKTVSSESDLVLTVANRVTGMGTDAPELLAIVPNVTKEACRTFNMSLGMDGIAQSNTSPNLSPYPEFVSSEKVKEIPRKLRRDDIDTGCFESQGNYYYYYTLYVF